MRIAFVGHAQAGKTEACKILASEFGGHIKSFASPLKHEIFWFLWMVRSKDGWTGEKVWKEVLEDKYSDFRLKLPDLLKVSLPPINPVGLDETEWINAHKKEVRSLLQFWGTDFRRSQDDQYWIKKFVNYFSGDMDDNFYCDDGRFENEIEVLRELGFTLIGVKSPPVPGVDWTHESEAGIEALWEKYEMPVILNRKEGLMQYRNIVLAQVEECIKQK